MVETRIGDTRAEDKCEDITYADGARDVTSDPDMVRFSLFRMMVKSGETFNEPGEVYCQVHTKVIMPRASAAQMVLVLNEALNQTAHEQGNA